MKIEKKVVSENTKWKTATKAGLTALMGIAASTSLIACGAPTGEIEEPLENSSDSDDIVLKESSSSQLVSSSQESVLSSEVNSPISSSNQLSSSNQVVVDIPKSSSPYNVDEILSSIVNPTQSSSSEAEISSSSSSSFVFPEDTIKTKDTLNSNIYLCPGDPGMCTIQSMLTTFESTDIDV